MTQQAPTYDPPPGAFWFRILGNSMSPALHDGDEVLFEPVCDALQPGQVVLFHAATGWVVHRVIECTRNAVVTRGDSCLRPDPATPRARIPYRVTWVKRRGLPVPIPYCCRGWSRLLTYALARWRTISHKLLGPYPGSDRFNSSTRIS